MTTQTPRPARSQIVLSVVRTEWLTPRMVRVVAGGAGFDDLVGNEFTDKYTKVIFVKPELALLPPYDLTALRESLPQHDWPVVRTYTIRRIDTEAREVVIDFVVHGTEGVAGPWAAGAVAGDESALPAIASALEAMPDGARGVAHIEVDDDTDVQMLAAPAGIILNWILRDGVRTPDLLATAVDDAEWPEGVDVQVFAHGEREAMKAVRAVLARRGIPRDRFSLSGYWAYGRTEDRFQAEKREPIGVIAD
jgi:NADPH-dependent ferric siderophore reductase